MYGVHAATTLIPILGEVSKLKGKITDEQLGNLLGSYVPFLIIPLLFVVRFAVFWKEPVEEKKIKKN
ncbi:hypothetical protein HDU97_000484 [Phlyctochytrium planicorne]|nr:hypothetical protein HDU97_000484 [Phlyctochytrium planicorne]